MANEVIASGQLKDAAELAALAERVGQRPVIALVPASDVVMTEVALPGKPNRQIIQALPYMLEEEHAEDIEQLFLALGAVRQHDNQYWQQVALCKKQQLELWLEQLSHAGFTATQLLPDALLLPLAADGMASTIELAGQWVLRQSDWSATSIDSGWWADYLSISGVEGLRSYSPWPAGLMPQAELADPELPLALLAQQLPQQKFSLLQGVYQPKKPQSKFWLHWKSTVVAAAACLVLYLTSLAVQTWQQERVLQQQRAELVQLFKSRFPGESTRNLSRVLNRLGKGGGNQDSSLFGLLLKLQPELAATGQIKLDTLKYDQKTNELRFQAQADSFQRFDSLKTKLEQTGFEVKQGALSNEGGKVVGTVSLRIKS